MSTNLPLGYETYFDEHVQQAYQATDKLMNKCRTTTNVQGKYAQIRIAGEGTAVPHIPNTPVGSGAIPLSTVMIELTDWKSPHRIDTFQRAKIGFDDIVVSGEAIGKSIGRLSTQIKINALQAGVTQTIAADYESPGTNTGFTVSKLLRALALFKDNNVDEVGTEWYCALSAFALQAALNDRRMSDADYNSFRALQAGELKKYCQFEFIIIGNMREGGLPLNGNIRSCYMWEKNSLGYGVGTVEGGLTIDKSIEFDGYLLNQRLSAGAKVIQPKGVIEVLVDETKANVITN